MLGLIHKLVTNQLGRCAHHWLVYQTNQCNMVHASCVPCWSLSLFQVLISMAIDFCIVLSALGLNIGAAQTAKSICKGGLLRWGLSLEDMQEIVL